MIDNKSVYIDHALEIHKNIYTVNWNIGNQCNYRCSYCSDLLNGGSAKWTEPEIINGFADRIIAQYSKNKDIVFEFTGGEVTLYKELYNVLKYLKERNCYTSILTNGSPKLDYWKKMKDVLDYVTLSFHAEHANAELFYSNVEYLHKHLNVHVNVMMHNKLFDISRSLGEKMLDGFNDLSLSFQPLLQSLTNEKILLDYTEEQMEMIKELDTARVRKMEIKEQRYKGEMREYFIDGRSNDISPERFIAERRNNWKGWFCWAGLEQIVITQERQVYRAWCLQDQVGEVGKEFDLPTNPVVCTKSKCHCNLDIATKKQCNLIITPDNIKDFSEVGVI
ncbi:MAG: radical SAM protein [Firmicutes bacterium]|nr:radical SAM protein [Bacillota bacterium]